MSPSTIRKRAVRIAGCSGGFTDRSTAITRMASDPDVDVVMGDWLSEMTMTLHGSGKVKNQKSSKPSTATNGTQTLEDRMKTAMYADTFLQCFESPAIPISHRKLRGIEGDDVTEQVQSLIKDGEQFGEWWHDWRNDQPFNRVLSYVCGGYYSMFKDLIKTGKHVNMGFPIAEKDSGDVVRVTGVQGLPPPPTTKIGITAPAGLAVRMHIYSQSNGQKHVRFNTLRFHAIGSCPPNPTSLDASTVDFPHLPAKPATPTSCAPTSRRIQQMVSRSLPACAPGLSLTNDLRQTHLPLRVHSLYGEREVKVLEAPTATREYPRQQHSYETSDPVDLSAFGPTAQAPLGAIVAGRSGDKAADCNCGFFLDRGYNASSEIDTFGQNAMEYMRAKTVEIPTKFLERGWI
ncbi:hypothetical protein J3E73DRAFT_394883 [Bipolaris maydis]|nr:hypothetical protein J3E73DRAFT_394883 [Bipolaris maydis]